MIFNSGDLFEQILLRISEIDSSLADEILTQWFLRMFPDCTCKIVEGGKFEVTGPEFV